MAIAAPETTTPETTSKTVKLTVALPSEAIETIESIATREQKTKTAVLREAIAQKAFFDAELAQPDTHLLIQRGDVTREIVFK
jgi:predicted transcriptional regulator